MVHTVIFTLILDTEHSQIYAHTCWDAKLFTSVTQIYNDVPLNILFYFVGIWPTVRKVLPDIVVQIPFASYMCFSTSSLTWRIPAINNHSFLQTLVHSNIQLKMAIKAHSYMLNNFRIFSPEAPRIAVFLAHLNGWFSYCVFSRPLK